MGFVHGSYGDAMAFVDGFPSCYADLAHSANGLRSIAQRKVTAITERVATSTLDISSNDVVVATRYLVAMVTISSFKPSKSVGSPTDETRL